MKKLIKILTFVSLGMLVLSLMAVLLVFTFRAPLMERLYGQAHLPFVLPVGNVVALLLQLAAVCWLCVCAGNRRFGIWSELLSVGTLVLLCPALSRLLSTLQSMVFGRARGSEYLMALSGAYTLWTYATCLAPLAVSLALVVCGMSMAFKIMAKKEYLTRRPL